ncbi:polysaccharide deacetylase family protein [Ferruginibacter lapsinanis]|uniref:polysaccharide deacetylase family protein n=1 Tax=Ferruginibacter lapsinanis TaxID=563172 RepID=UPI001E434426|nr:polysaccharide deacetylase family protein [Ferruginibacter lapsinanis]UEG50733.1 polysaccharide deacetylase family protein [Ferruginibacter lapsinanis]
MKIEEIKTYKDYAIGESFFNRSRGLLRKAVLYAKAFNSDINKTNDWVRFPYYHHVFDDEKKGFERQLKYLKNYGEFISIDKACELINGREPIDGRFFCVSFDDGFYNCYSNMMEITSHLDIPVIIYLPTNSIGLDINNEADIEELKKNNLKNPKIISFLNWDNCKEMLSQKISFGSHTCNHANLSKLNYQEIEKELRESKLMIESKLNINCDHFACPWGRTGIDFNPEITTEIAKKTGYTSFATTNRGKMQKGDNLYLIKRDHIIANWENFQLKYFFSR